MCLPSTANTVTNSCAHLGGCSRQSEKRVCFTSASFHVLLQLVSEGGRWVGAAIGAFICKWPASLCLSLRAHYSVGTYRTREGHYKCKSCQPCQRQCTFTFSICVFCKLFLSATVQKWPKSIRQLEGAKEKTSVCFYLGNLSVNEESYVQKKRQYKLKMTRRKKEKTIERIDRWECRAILRTYDCSRNRRELVAMVSNWVVVWG